MNIDKEKKKEEHEFKEVRKNCKGMEKRNSETKTGGKPHKETN